MAGDVDARYLGHGVGKQWRRGLFGSGDDRELDPLLFRYRAGVDDSEPGFPGKVFVQVEQCRTAEVQPHRMARDEFEAADGFVARVVWVAL